jgi:hypothetical protein
MANLKNTIAATVADTAGPFPDLADLRLQILETLDPDGYRVARLAMRFDAGLERRRQPSVTFSTAAPAAQPRSFPMSTRLYAVERELADVRRARYDLARLRDELEPIAAASNTAKIRELHRVFDFDLGSAIADVEGKSSAECDIIIRAIKSCCKRRIRTQQTPEETIEEAHTIGPKMKAKATQYAMKGIHRTSAELRAEIAAESVTG